MSRKLREFWTLACTDNLESPQLPIHPTVGPHQMMRSHLLIRCVSLCTTASTPHQSNLRVLLQDQLEGLEHILLLGFHQLPHDMRFSSSTDGRRFPGR